jgi:hypothetical protein
MAYTMLTATWQGTIGGTGYTRMRWLGNLLSAEVTQQLNAMKTFFGAVAGSIPSAVSISYSGLAQEYDDAGKLTKEVSVAAPAQTAGSSAAAFGAPCGTVVNWETGQFNAQGHRIRGRTYLVPLGSTAFQTDGTMGSGTITAIQAAANTLVTGLIPMVVVSKTKTGVYTGIKNVTAASVPDRVCILRSRRD